MSNQRKPASKLLPTMVEAFPRTFFADPNQVQPLKVNIHQDLFAALPPGVEQPQIRRFLSWYINRPDYQRALAEGKSRVDLTGAVVESEIPAAIREQARERWQQSQQARAAHKSGATGKPSATGKPALPPPRPAPSYRRCRSTWRSFNNDLFVG